jgi:hypothetical protein
MKRTPASITVLERIKDPYGCRALIVAWASPINLSHVWSPGIWEHEEVGAKTGGNRMFMWDVFRQPGVEFDQ